MRAYRSTLQLENEICALLEKADGFRNTMRGHNNPIRVQEGFTNDPVYRAVEKLVDDYAEEIKRLTADIAVQQSDIHKIELVMINARLTYNERSVLRFKYKFNYSWGKICEAVIGKDSKAISPSTAYRLHDSAFKKIELYLSSIANKNVRVDKAV
jgi:hypothetical protein